MPFQSDDGWVRMYKVAPPHNTSKQTFEAP
jgi:hypothetical protein